MASVVSIIPGFRFRGADLDAPTTVGTAGQVLTRSGARGTAWQDASGGGTSDHGALTGLGDDDHSIYALLAGRAGGQTLTGGTATGNTLTLKSNTLGDGKTRIGGASMFVVDEATGRVGIGTASPVAYVDAPAS